MGRQKEISLAFYNFFYSNFSSYSQEILKELSTARFTSDDESIHRLRVALRRLETIINVFRLYLPPKSINSILKEVTSLLRKLTCVRDLEVQKKFLHQEQRINPDPKNTPGLQRLMLRIGQKRAVQLIKVNNIFGKVKKNRRLEKLLCIFQSRSPEKIDHPENILLLKKHAHKHIKKAVSHLITLENCLNDSEDKKSLHTMRISVKYLRYNLELFQPLFGKKLDKSLILMKRIQTDLGEIHDCDVWLEYLRRFKEKELTRTIKFLGDQKSFVRIEPGIAWFEENTIAKRKVLFLRFRRAWSARGKIGVSQILLPGPDQKRVIASTI